MDSEVSGSSLDNQDASSPGCSSQEDPFPPAVAGPSCSKDNNEEKHFTKYQAERLMALIDKYIENVSNLPMEENETCDINEVLRKVIRLGEARERNQNEVECSDNADSSPPHASSNGKKRKSKTYENLPSDESDLLSSNEGASDEESTLTSKKLFKSTVRDILDAGYEKIRKKFGRTPIYKPIDPKIFENVTFHPDVIAEAENPLLDEQDLAKIDYETTDDFSHFIIHEYPNLPDEEENTENNEAVQKWLASMDQQDKLPAENIDRKRRRFDVLNDELADFLASRKNSDAAKNCNLTSNSETKRLVSKQTRGKKASKVTASPSKSKACSKQVVQNRVKATLSKRQKAKATGKTSRKVPGKGTKRTDFKKFSSPSPKKMKTDLTSKATSKQHKVNLKNNLANKSPVAASRRARKSLFSETSSGLSAKKAIVPKSPLAKRGRLSVAVKTALKKSDGKIKNGRLIKSPVVKRGKLNMADEIVSKKSKGSFKNEVVLKSPVAKKSGENSPSKLEFKQTKDMIILKFSSESPLKKMKTSVANKNAKKADNSKASPKTKQVTLKQSNESSASCSKLSPPKKSKSVRGSLPPKEKISKQSKAQKNVFKSVESVKTRAIKSKKSILSDCNKKKQLKNASSPKSSIQGKNLGMRRHTTCQTMPKTQSVKNGMKSQKIDTSFSGKIKCGSQQSKSGKPSKSSTIKKGLKQSKASETIQSKKIRKSPGKAANDSMLRAGLKNGRAMRMKKK